MIACTSPDETVEIDALDDLGAVLERDVQILQLQRCQVRDSSVLEGKAQQASLVTLHGTRTLFAKLGSTARRAW